MQHALDKVRDRSVVFVAVQEQIELFEDRRSHIELTYQVVNRFGCEVAFYNLGLGRQHGGDGLPLSQA